MVGLYSVAVPGQPGLDPVGVDRALNEVIGPEPPGLILEDPDELLPDDLPLLLGVDHALEPPEKPLPRIHHHQVEAPVLEGCLHLGGLVRPHEALVDVDGHQVPSQGFPRQRRGYAGVHAPAQGDDGLPVPHGVLDRPDRLLRPVQRPPVGLTAADLENIVPEHLAAVHRVDHLGVPLEAPDRFLVVPHGGYRSPVGVRHDSEALRRLENRVSVAHPHLLAGVQPLQHPDGFIYVGLGHAVLSGLRQLSAVHRGEELEPVA